MRNPWLDIPLGDYESHMGSPAVAQLEALADLFQQALEYSRPASLAILGIAGGNGLDRVDTAVTRRIVGFDIHPTYLETVRERYPNLPLRLVCADLNAEAIQEEPLDLVHAALIFEHAGIDGCLQNAVSLVAARGYLSVVLQLPSALDADVAKTHVSSIQTLRDHFRLIDRAELDTALASMGFRLLHEQRCELPGGKAFWLGISTRRPTARP